MGWGLHVSDQTKYMMTLDLLVVLVNGVGVIIGHIVTLIDG